MHSAVLERAPPSWFHGSHIARARRPCVGPRCMWVIPPVHHSAPSIRPGCWAPRLCGSRVSYSVFAPHFAHDWPAPFAIIHAPSHSTPGPSAAPRRLSGAHGVHFCVWPQCRVSLLRNRAPHPGTLLKATRTRLSCSFSSQASIKMHI